MCIFNDNSLIYKIGKFDQTCFTYTGHGYAAGGWNVDMLGLRPNWTERYDAAGREWNALNLSQTEMPDIFRSSGYGVVENKPALIGGVSCTVKAGGGTECTKTNTVYRLRTHTEPDNYKWEEASEKVTTPRSSHLVIVAPNTVKFGCGAIAGGN